MFFLVFYIGDERYLLESRKIIEIVPFVDLKKTPKAPDYLTGMLSYRGNLVPVIDMRRLTDHGTSRRLMSTRIVLVNYSNDETNDITIGLIVERATEMIKQDPSDFVKSGLNNKNTPYLTKVISDDSGVMQWVDVDSIVPQELREMLRVDFFLECS